MMFGGCVQKAGIRPQFEQLELYVRHMQDRFGESLPFSRILV
jgi:hypothetical protein